MDAKYPHQALTYEIIGAFFDVYNELGSGFRELVYERAMILALQGRNIPAERQVPIPVRFGHSPVATFRADIIVAGRVLVELKAIAALEPGHAAQVLNALRASSLEVGLLLNFGPKSEIKRLVLSRPQIRRERR
jgi:GxxExxY protein